jgi:hypothetical protein
VQSGARSPGLRTIATTTFLLGGITGAALYATLAPSRATPVATVEHREPPAATATPSSTVAAVSVVQRASAVEAVPAAPPMATVRPVQPPPSRPASSSQAPRPSQLAAERMLLDEARGGLVQGEPERALDRLSLHRSRYPTGLLAEERDAMFVEALAKSGRYEAARQAAEAFRARAPSSLFLPTVESAVTSTP